MRLTKDIKNQIINNAVIKAGFKLEAEKLVKERADIAEKLRRTTISEKQELKITSLIEELESTCKAVKIDPQIYTTQSSEIDINFNGQRLDVRFNGTSYSLIKSGLIDNSDSVCKYVTRNRISVVDDFGMFENQEKIDDLCNRAKSLKAEVMAVLSKVNTDKQLIKLWPESIELIPQHVSGQCKDLMVDTSELNKLMKLPS